MASNVFVINSALFFLLALAFSSIPHCSSATPRMLALIKQDPIILKYHKGALLKGNVTVNLIWYGKFTPAQRSIIVDFIQSLNSPSARPLSVASWWHTTSKYKGGPSNIILGKQVHFPNHPLGKAVDQKHIIALAAKVGKSCPTGITVVLTAKDVAVEEFCMNTCGMHGSYKHGSSTDNAYLWVGDSIIQCPGECAWPFHKPLVGPQTPPLVAPNKDVGIDGMVINLATLLAGTVTNPFDGGYFQGPPTFSLEAVTACTGMFGSGAFPGYPGKLLVDKKTGASYNAVGGNGRKYLLPAMWSPTTKTCKTLI